MIENELDELNAAVALTLGWEREDDAWWTVKRGPNGGALYYAEGSVREFSPSRNWAQAGPIIERERIEIGFMGAGHGWQAAVNPESQADWQIPWYDGPTPLIAAMRALVESKKAHVSSQC